MISLTGKKGERKRRGGGKKERKEKKRKIFQRCSGHTEGVKRSTIERNKFAIEKGKEEAAEIQDGIDQATSIREEEESKSRG